MAKFFVLCAIVLCATSTSYPGVAMFESFEDIRQFTDSTIKYKLDDEVELPLYSLQIKDDTYSLVFLADQIFYHHETNCTWVTEGDAYDSLRMGFTSSFYLIGNMEITSTTAPNIIANFNFTMDDAYVTLDTTFGLKDGYSMFSGKLNSVEFPTNYTLTLIEGGDVPLPPIEQQQKLKEIIAANEKFIVDDLLVAFTNLAESWYDWANKQLYNYNVYDGYTRHTIDTRQTMNPVHGNGTQGYMKLSFNGTFFNDDDLLYDPTSSLDEIVNTPSDLVYRFSDWWMAQYFLDNFEQPDWSSVHDHVVNVIPQLRETYGQNETYNMELSAKVSQPVVVIKPDYQTLTMSLQFTITPVSTPNQPGLTLGFDNFVNVTTTFPIGAKHPHQYNAHVTATLNSYDLLYMDIIQSNLTSALNETTLDNGLTQIADQYVLPYYVAPQYPLFLTGFPNIWNTHDPDFSITPESGYIEVACNSTGY